MFNDRNTPNQSRVVFSKDARKELFKGLNIAADAVGCTLGPKGKTVIIQQNGRGPLVTKDGVTVSKSVKLKDPLQRMGAELVCEAASQTNEVAGDGTTTATVLTQAMVKEGLKLLAGGFSAQELCECIERTTSKVITSLVSGAKQLTTTDEIAQVATISANGDKNIGDIIAKAMDKVGKDGIITVEEAKGMATSLVVVEGMQFDRGYISPYFVTNGEKLQAMYENAYVLLSDKKISSLAAIVPILEKVARDARPLLIIAEDVDGEALNGLVLNVVKGGLKVVAVKSPGYGQHREELMRDISVLTGAKLVSSSTGVAIEKLELTDLGKVGKVVVDGKSTTLVGSGLTVDAVATHVAELRTQLEDVTLSEEDIIKLKMRVAKLASGVAVIKVGGVTEVEMRERKDRVEDALNATKAAVEEGIVPGGGMALLNASAMTKVIGEPVGNSIVYAACEAPLRKICSNAGVTPEVVLNSLNQQMIKSDVQFPGYNAATGEVCDMVHAGVIDPVKVTRVALKNAASVAITFLSLDAAVVEDGPELLQEE